MTSLPQDPQGAGISSSSAGECITAGNSYAYYTDPSGSLYAITSTKESKKGNASACGDTIDKNKDGSFEKVGQGLKNSINLSTSSYTPKDCFEFSNGTITNYYNNELNNSSNVACPKDVSIPESINGIPVTTIGSYAFYNKGLTSVILSNSIVLIDTQAFFLNQINNSLIIPSSVMRIRYAAFANNQITSVDIPNSVIEFGSSVFANNRLTSVTIPNSITTLYNDSFSNNLLTSVTIPNSITTMWGNTFAGNNLTSITIPSSVTTIGYGVFSRNNLTTITIPSSVTYLENAFQNNGPTKNSSSITTSLPQAHGTRNLVGTTWVKQ